MLIHNVSIFKILDNNMATRSGAGVGVGIFRGLWFLGNPKESTNRFVENTKIPRRSNMMGKCQYFPKNMFDLIRFTYVLKI